MFANETVRVSLEPGPTWKVTAPVLLPAEPSRRLIPLNCTEPCWRLISEVSWLTSSWMSVWSLLDRSPFWYCTASSLTRWSMLCTLFSALSAVWTIEVASLTFWLACCRPLT